MNVLPELQKKESLAKQIEYIIENKIDKSDLDITQAKNDQATETNSVHEESNKHRNNSREDRKWYLIYPEDNFKKWWDIFMTLNHVYRFAGGMTGKGESQV